MYAIRSYYDLPGDQPIGQAQGRHNRCSTEQVARRQLVKIKNDDLSWNRHQGRRHHQADRNHVTVEIHSDVDENLNGDKHREKGTERRQNVIDLSYNFV